MAGPGTEALLGELGMSPAELPVVEAMTDEDARLVAQLVAEARQAQESALEQAQDEALAHLPRVMRGMARRILLGGG